MQKVLRFLIGGMLTAILFSCHNNIDLPTDTPNSNPSFPSTMVQASVSGLVKDQSGSFIADANVSWGNAQTTTDQNGYFKLTSAVQERKAVLTIQKTGYFKMVQTLQAFENQTVQTKIQLVNRQLSGTVSTNSGGEITTSDGAKINFAASGFQDANGNAYTGEVQVFAYYLDPTVANLTEVMPGNLTALNTEEVPQILQSFGMLNVELEGNAGQSLQINQPATMTMPVPNSLQNNAPTSIPLWYFEEATGLWMEEGAATLEGEVYVGTVNHFTWWNCDIPLDFVYLNGEIDAGEFLPVVDIKITNLSTGIFGIMSSSTDGTFGGFVPKNASLALEILNICGDIIHSEEIGPLTENTDIGIISVSLGSETLSIISGTVLNCENMPVQNGYVFVTVADTDLDFIFELDAEGNFSGIIEHCSNPQLFIQATDLDLLIQSETIEVQAAETVNIGTLSACEEEIESTLILNYNGQEVLMIDCIIEENGFDGFENFYAFSATHQSGNGTVNYQFLIFTDSVNSMTNTVFLDLDYNVFGTPDIIYALNSNNVEIISTPTNPGEFLEFTIEDVNVTEVPGGLLSESGTIVGKLKLE